jgi:hypothetical protein
MRLLSVSVFRCFETCFSVSVQRTSKRSNKVKLRLVKNKIPSLERVLFGCGPTGSVGLCGLRWACNAQAPVCVFVSACVRSEMGAAMHRIHPAKGP